MTDREVGLDRLRGLGVLAVFTLHWCVPYMRHAPAWWYVADADGSIVLSALAALLDATAIPLLFTLAGYFTGPSLERHGALAFVRARAHRLGLPLILGVALVVPPTTWLYAGSRGLSTDLWGFWTRGFWGAPFNQGVYWYLGVLLSFGAVAALASVVRRPGLPPASPPPLPFPPVALLVPALFAAGMAIGTPLDEWRHTPLLAFQPARLPVYACLYAFGLHAWRSGWRPESAAPAPWTPLLTALGAATFLFLGIRADRVAGAADRVVLACAYSTLSGLFVLTALRAAPALAKARSKALDSLAHNAFGIYLLHLPPLLMCTLAARNLDLPLWPRALGVHVAALGATWTVCLAYDGWHAGREAARTRKAGAQRGLSGSRGEGASPPPGGRALHGVR